MDFYGLLKKVPNSVCVEGVVEKGILIGQLHNVNLKSSQLYMKTYCKHIYNGKKG